MTPQPTRGSKLQPSTPLTLTGDWLTKPEYYATIQTGDVDGDGRDDVVARGPFGIRTWFYDRRGTGGWERYLPEGYPDFPGVAPTQEQPGTGQAAAYDKLNKLAEDTIPASTWRGVWASEARPDPTSLATCSATSRSPAGQLQQPDRARAPEVRVVRAACAACRCTNPFTAADWTAVVNELLAESHAALEVVSFFTAHELVTSMRQSLFIAEGAELPAIGDKLGLQAAANTP